MNNADKLQNWVSQVSNLMWIARSGNLSKETSEALSEIYHEWLMPEAERIINDLRPKDDTPQETPETPLSEPHPSGGGDDEPPW